MQSAKCMLCDSDAVSFRWTSLISDGRSLIEIDFSSYCLRCGHVRMKTLHEIHNESPEKFALYILPEEKSG